MKRWVALLGILVVLAGAAGAAGWVLYQRTQEPFRGYATAEQFVDVAGGQGSMAIGRRRRRELLELRVPAEPPAGQSAPTPRNEGGGTPD